MNIRLKIAKKLLSDKGVIFISIDDNEQAQLKLLCDSILGGRNFRTVRLKWNVLGSPLCLSQFFSVQSLVAN